MTVAKILSDPLLEALRANGVATDDTRRVVIDIQAGCAPIVYVEKYGDRSLIKVIEALSTVDVVKVPTPDSSD